MTDRSQAGASLSRRARQFLAARFDPRSQVGLGLTISLILFVLGVWVLSSLLEAVLDNETLVRFDLRAAAWIHDRTTTAGLTFFSIVTQLGAPAVDALIVIVAFYLWRARAPLLLWSWLAANLGGKVIEHVLKITVHRIRPEYGTSYVFSHSASFPSGHAIDATICYLFLAYLIASRTALSQTTKLAAYGAAVGIIALVSSSRLYLGVHYPSDVLGGIAAGLAWLSVCHSTRRLLASRRDVT